MRAISPEQAVASSIGKALLRWGRLALNTLLPMECMGCSQPLTDNPVPFFCRSCWDEIRPLTGPVCPRCGYPFPSELSLTYSPTHLCGECRHHKPAFTQARSLFTYEGVMRKAIHLLKYQGKVSLVPHLTTLMNAAWQPIPNLDLVLPVPLHPARLKDREFNQALLLADQLAKEFHIPVSFRNLRRGRVTPAQTNISRKARRKNLRRTFFLKAPQDIKGQRVLLVDDVLTTGTTVNECAKALRKAGSSDVYVVTLARTL